MDKWKSIVVSLTLAAPALAQDTPAGDTLQAAEEFPEGEAVIIQKGEGGGPRILKFSKARPVYLGLAEELALTEGQKAQLKADREAHREARRAQHEKRREIHKQLREAIDAGADQATLDRLGAELGKLQVAGMQAGQEQRLQFEAILTGEQKAKLEELRAERRERWKEKRKRWHRDHED